MVENRKRESIDVYLQNIKCTLEKQRKLEHQKVFGDHIADTDKNKSIKQTKNVEEKLTSAFFSDLPERNLIANYEPQFSGQSCLGGP